MKRLALAALFLLALVPGAGAGGPAPVSALEWRLGGGVTLLRLDATTLKPLAGLRIDLGAATHPVTLSPDRRRLLAAGDNQLRVADLRTGRVTDAMSPGGWVAQALWTRPGTIAAITATRVVLVDARRMVATRYIELNGAVLGSARAGRRVVLLLGPEDAIGGLRIALVDGAGKIRSAPLPLRGGNSTLRNEERNPVGMRSEVPGLAVDPSGKRAVVAGPAGIVEVDLTTLRSTPHALGGRTTQKRIEGWQRQALWLDPSHVATSGAEFDGERSTPLPVQIVDVRDWTVRQLDEPASYIARWHSRLLTIGGSLKAYSASGDLLSTILSERFRGQVVPGETWLYVETSGRGTKWLVLDWNGRVMGTRTFARPTNIVPLL